MFLSRSEDETVESSKKPGIKERLVGSTRFRSSGEENPGEDDRDDVTVDKKTIGILFAKKKSKLQKKVVYRYFGDLAKEVIEVETELGVPKPESETDVVIKVHSSTVSHNDCILRRGVSPSFSGQAELPATPGFDVVGNILACGEHVKEFVEGDRVAALVRTGGNARYAVVPASSLVRVPQTVGSADAASMVSTYMTAYQAFNKATEVLKGNNCDYEEDEDGSAIKIKKSLKGKSVLVTGGLGPVGQALIELSKKAGASKIVATAPQNRHTYLRMVLGIKPLPLLPQDWLPSVEGKMDVVFDGQCQDGFESPQRALSEEGILICIGMHSLLNSEGMGVFGAPMSAIWAGAKANWLMSKTKSYEVWSSFQENPEKFKTDLAQVFALLQKRQIKSHITKRVTLNDVADSQYFIEKGKAHGTIVCMPWQRGRKLRDQEDGANEDGEERDD